MSSSSYSIAASICLKAVLRMMLAVHSKGWKISRLKFLLALDHVWLGVHCARGL